MYYNRGMDESLTIRLGSELGRALENAARKAGISKGELARQALADRLRNPARCRSWDGTLDRCKGPKT